MYKMTAKNKIPMVKRAGTKKLLFSRAKLIEWLEEEPTMPVSIDTLVEQQLHLKPRVRRA